MSGIRFVHTDFLRLGSPLTGIAQPPTWLQSLAAECVRTAVRNIVETTLARQAQLLVIAGSVCDSQEDLDPAVRWLNEQFAQLRRAGVRIAAFADDSRTATALGSVCDVVLTRSETLHVAPSGSGLQLSRMSALSGSCSGLTISAGASVTPDAARLLYQAVPAVQPSADCDRTSVRGFLALSAGAAQTVSPSETWNCGCIVVDADLNSRELTSTFSLCNPVRYASEQLDLSDVTTVERLTSEIVRATREADRHSGQTVIAAWQVRTGLTADVQELAGLDEQHLLQRLRNQLEAGHKGVWPASVTFTRSATLQLSSSGGESVEQYFDVVTGTVDAYDVNTFADRRIVLRGGAGISAELIAGLQLLNRVA
ncbi:MAG: hypothetical protein R3C49_17555 [Planctomycetaceae bacterium]